VKVQESVDLLTEHRIDRLLASWLVVLPLDAVDPIAGLLQVTRFVSYVKFAGLIARW